MTPPCASPFLQPGNSVPFLDLVERLTEAPLTADAWVKELQVPVEVKVGGWMYRGLGAALTL